MRSCISANDSPPGKRNPLGYCCTVFHSGSLRSSFSSPPVHSPKSHSSSPCLGRTRSLRTLAIGAAVSRVRSSGEAYTAATFFSPAMRAAAPSACARPGVARGAGRVPGPEASARWWASGRGGRAAPASRSGAGAASGGRRTVDRQRVERSACRLATYRFGPYPPPLVEPLPRPIGSTSSPRSRPTSSPAGPARGSWRGGSRSAPRSGRRSVDDDYWARPVPAFGDPGSPTRDRRPGAGRARCQPHGSDVHR